MRKVLIKYGFVFDPSQTWSTQDQFDEDLAAYFRAKGLQAELVEAAPGQEPIPIIFLTKAPQSGSGPVQFTKKALDG
jgi:hypothetical protein